MMTSHDPVLYRPHYQTIGYKTPCYRMSNYIYEKLLQIEFKSQSMMHKLKIQTADSTDRNISPTDFPPIGFSYGCVFNKALRAKDLKQTYNILYKEMIS